MRALIGLFNWRVGLLGHTLLPDSQSVQTSAHFTYTDLACIPVFTTKTPFPPKMYKREHLVF